MQVARHISEDLARRLRLTSREIAAALALSIAAGAFLFATFVDGPSRRGNPIASVTAHAEKL